MDVLPVPAKYMAAARHKGTLLQDHNNFLYNKSRMGVQQDQENDDGAGDEIIPIRGDRNHDSDLMAEAA